MTSSRRHKMRAAARITVVGGSVVVNGQPAGAATLIVTNTDASGAGSLADQIDNAAPGDTIDFQTGLAGTIILDGPNHKIDSDLTIVGPGRDEITLTNNAGGVLYVYNEAELTLSGLTIAVVSGGGTPQANRVNDGGDLVVTDVSISNIAEQAIYVSHDSDEASDSVTLTDVDVTDVGFAATNRVNELVAELNSDGELCLFTSADAQVLVDVVGYIGSPSSFTSVDSSRLLDTRPTGKTLDAQDQGVGNRQAGAAYTLDVEGRVGVSASATAVVVNVTAVAPEGRGYVTVHSCLPTLPLASSLNFVQGVKGPNEIVATLSPDGKICLFNSTTTHLVVDIVGFLE